MKFDLIVSNPPWDTGLGQGLDLPFRRTTAYATFNYHNYNLITDNSQTIEVLPTNWMCQPNYQGWRKWMITHWQIEDITIYSNNNKKLFNIQLSDVVVLVLRKVKDPNNTQVRFNNQGQTSIIDLTKYSVWPMYYNQLSVDIFDECMNSKISDIINYNGGNTLKHQTPHTLYFISNHILRSGNRINYKPYTHMKLNEMYSIKYPMWLGFDTEDEVLKYWEWVHTPHYAYVLSMIQSTPKNQPIYFALMGLHNFKDTDFNRHFNITNDQQEEISKWILNK